MEVSGYYDGRFEHLATLLHDSVDSGADLGGSVARRAGRRDGR